jgi:hypothetical protein
VWLVSFMQYDLGFFDHETGRITSAENPFGAKVLPVCPAEFWDRRTRCERVPPSHSSDFPSTARETYPAPSRPRFPQRAVTIGASLSAFAGFARENFHHENALSASPFLRRL